MKPTGTIDYETLAQDAMRGVIVKILKMTEQSGLPGEHHFYISFDTNAPGVSISKRLRQQYPDVMTIVLQHRFWDLAVSDERFEVKLTFDSIPERLVVPYDAIKVFFDPSVRYALQFDAPDIDGTGDTRAGPTQAGTIPSRPTERSLTPLQPRPVATLDRPQRPAPSPALVPVVADTDNSDTTDTDAAGVDEATEIDRSDTAGGNVDNIHALRGPTPDRDEAAPVGADPDQPPEVPEVDTDAPASDDAHDDDDDDQGAVVVSLDAFRKK